MFYQYLTPEICGCPDGRGCYSSIGTVTPEGVTSSWRGINVHSTANGYYRTVGAYIYRQICGGFNVKLFSTSNTGKAMAMDYSLLKTPPWPPVSYYQSNHKGSFVNIVFNDGHVKGVIDNAEDVNKRKFAWNGGNGGAYFVKDLWEAADAEN